MMWKDNSLHKNKNLLWHICHNYIFIHVQLLLRHVLCLVQFPWCVDDDRDVMHSFVGCGVARE